jgi:hypothetical protein
VSEDVEKLVAPETAGLTHRSNLSAVTGSRAAAHAAG